MGTDLSPAEEHVGHVTGGIVLVVVLGLVLAWPLMLALGILHHHWPIIPAWSYWETYVLYLGVGFVRSALR